MKNGNGLLRRMATALLALEIRPDATCIVSRTGHTLPVTAIAFNADASLSATCSHDSLIQLWRVQRDGSLCSVSTLTGHSNPVCDVAFSPCGRLLASCSMNAMIILWALTSDASCICKTRLQHHSEAVFCIAFSPRGGLLAAGSGDHCISLTRYNHDASAHVIHELTGHSSWVLSLAFHPSALQLCSGAKDASIRYRTRLLCASAIITQFHRLWSLCDGHTFGRCIATLNGHAQAVYSISYVAPSHQCIFVTSCAGTARWETCWPVAARIRVSGCGACRATAALPHAHARCPTTPPLYGLSHLVPTVCSLPAARAMAASSSGVFVPGGRWCRPRRLLPHKRAWPTLQ